MSTPTTKMLFSSGSTFEDAVGYSRVVVTGDQVFIAGTTGFDYETMTIADDIVTQTEQCLRNLERALHAAETTWADVVRVLYLVPDASSFEATWPTLHRVFGTSRPASTMMEVGLADPRMKIEIELTAIRGCGASIESAMLP